MSNWKPWIFCSDVHGDQLDLKANKALFKFIDEFKPVIRVAGGDIWDMAALRKKASEEEKRCSIRIDYEMGREWFLRFKPNHFLLGNHDKRLFDLAEAGKGPISDYAAVLTNEIRGDCTKLKCPIYPWHKRDGIARIGNLKCLHGFATGIGAARRMAQVYGACVFGHGHSPMFASIEGLEARTGRMSGCLSKLDLEYVDASLGSLNWRHGWLYGVVNEKTGDYHCWSAEEIEGKFVVTMGVREL